jgi:hypothetical protein
MREPGGGCNPATATIAGAQVKNSARDRSTEISGPFGVQNLRAKAFSSLELTEREVE